METKLPINDIIRRRFSCRTYLPTIIATPALQTLASYAAARTTGPLGSSARFEVAAASDESREALKGLGTYGTIKSPTGFIIGAVGHGPHDLEDFGYLLEQIILQATMLELGTCWLGGFFQRSAFARKMDLQPGESMPAVSSLGYIGQRDRLTDRFIRRSADADQRMPWQQLFFQDSFSTPLDPAGAGPYSEALEMVRLGPSASNKQPWRIVREGNSFHFYLKRTPAYHKNSLSLIKLPDLQRVDIGIAMSHFEMSAREAGLAGSWVFQAPSLTGLPSLTEYIVSYLQNPA